MTPLLTLLEPLIGTRLTLDGVTGIVIDVLNDPPALILSTAHEMHIECDHLGRPQQQVGGNHTVSLLSTQGTALNPSLQRQLPAPLAQALHQLLTQDAE